MSIVEGKKKVFPVVGPGAEKPPDHSRLMAGMSRRELAAEIAAGKGTDDYKAALNSELRQRNGG